MWQNPSDYFDADEDLEEAEGPPSREELREAYVISDRRRGGYELHHMGREIAWSNDFDDLVKAAYAHMEKSNWYPGVYHVNDHGNVSRLDSEGKEVASWV